MLVISKRNLKLIFCLQLLFKKPYHLPVTLQEENTTDSKYAKPAHEL
jgi:hypothetical protein